MLDLSKQCPELLKEIVGFPNDGAGTKLEDIYAESKVAQTTLRTALGLNDYYGFEINEDVDLETNFKHSKQLMLALLDDKDAEFVKANPQSLWENKLESGMKISKAIARTVAQNAHIVKLFNVITADDANKSTSEVVGKSLIGLVKEELPKLPDADLIQLIKNPMVFVQNFLSEVAVAKTKRIGFTLDMFDFFRGCNSPNFTSCYTVRKHYNSAAPVAYALSGRAGMIFNRNADSILGRCWVIFSNNMKSFVVMKTYGFLPDESIHAVACNLCSTLNKDASWYKIPYVSHNLFTLTPGSGIYGDPIKYGYSSVTKKGTPFLQTDIDNVQSRCIMCGVFSGSTLLCEDCRRTLGKCKKCGVFLSGKFINKHGLCPTCMSQHTVCPSCGKTLISGVECECTKQQQVCSFCGAPSIVSINGFGMCAECAKIIYETSGTCAVCGDSGLMYPYKKHPVCRRCYAILHNQSANRYIDSVYNDEQRQIARALLRGEGHD